MLISSKSNKIIKLVKSLYKKKYKDLNELFIIEGRKFVCDTLKNNYDKVKYVITTDENFDDLNNVIYVTNEIYEYISDTKSPQGYMAIVKTPEFSIEDIDFSKVTNVLFLDNMQDSINTGALIRTAACAGFSLVIYTASGADPFLPKAVRASAGSVINIDILKTDDYKILDKLKENNFDIIASTLNGDETLHLNETNNVLIVGNEGSGITDDCLAHCTKFIKIPISNNCNSLNANISGSILMYKIIGYYN